MKKNNSTVLVVIIVLGILGYFGYKQFYSRPSVPPTPIVASNVQTYTGNGFSFQYPSGYTVTPVAFVSTPQYASGTTVQVKNATSSISVTESANSQNLTLANALGNGPYLSYAATMLSGKTVQKYSIGGVDGVGVPNIAVGQSGVALDVIWLNKGTIYQATTSTAEGATALTQLLSTFTFTN